MYIFKITFSIYIKVINTYTIKISLCLKHLCLKLSFFLYNKYLYTSNRFMPQNFFLSDGNQRNKHTEQFPSTDGEGQSHSSHNHYAAEKLTLCIGFQS